MFRCRCRTADLFFFHSPPVWRCPSDLTRFLPPAVRHDFVTLLTYSNSTELKTAFANRFLFVDIVSHMPQRNLSLEMNIWPRLICSATMPVAAPCRLPVRQCCPHWAQHPASCTPQASPRPRSVVQSTQILSLPSRMHISMCAISYLLSRAPWFSRSPQTQTDKKSDDFDSLCSFSFGSGNCTCAGNQS